MTRVLLITLAILFISGSGIYLVFARDLSAARARLIGHSKAIATPFGTLEYAVVGDGDPILIIHGAGGGFDQGIEMTGALAAHGYRLIVPSRFGYLASSLPANPTTAMQADAYIELLNNLGINKVFVLGISAGEWSAFAIRDSSSGALPCAGAYRSCQLLAAKQTELWWPACQVDLWL